MDFRGSTGWTGTLRSLIVEAEGELGMRSILKSRVPIGMPFVPSLESVAVSIGCPECQSNQVRRSRTRGIAELLLAFLLIQSYRCEECDNRFFRWTIRHKPKPTRPARRTNARDCNLLTSCKTSQHGHAPCTDLD